jgi:DNA-binding CsgD family transcriptional regulator/ligand-binding sensor domain-containing protein/cell division protein FtsL
MKLCVTIAALIICVNAFAQHTIGIPDIVNFSRKQYSGGTQNWDIRQDKEGIMYVANNDGLLTFDGSFWKKYRLPDRTHMRSVEPANDGRIYIGGQDNIGYFFPDATGSLVYHSLTQLVPADERSMGEIWDIIILDQDVFFRSREKILRLHNNTITVFRPQKEWRYMDLANGRLVAQDAGSGLYVFEKDQWLPLPQAQALPADFTVTSMLYWHGDSTLVTTLKHGLYFLSRSGFQKLNNPALESLTPYRMYATCQVNDDFFLIATRLNGCYIADRSGKLVQHFSKAEGLQNNDVLCVFLDKDRNLWLGLDNGIDFIAYNNAIKHIYPESQNGVGGYASVLYHGQLFLATSGGLYRSPIDSNGDLSFSKGSFEAVSNTSGQVWNVSVVNDHLFMGHHEGAFLIEGNTAKPIAVAGGGYWTFLPLNNGTPTPWVLGGNYHGISIWNGAMHIDTTIKIESARFIAIDEKEKAIWMAHPYKGLFKISYRNHFADSIRRFSAFSAPLSINNNFVFKVSDKIILCSERGVFEYNPGWDKFIPSLFFNNLFKRAPVSYLKEDASGNIWFVSGFNVGVIDLSVPNAPRLIYIPELYNQSVAGFEHINPINLRNVLIGAEKGFYHLNYEAYRKNLDRPIPVHITSVTAFGEKDSLLFGGYRVKTAAAEIAYRFNSLRFEFSSASYARQKNIEYSYWLEGFDQRWSDWTPKAEKEYTNLGPGTYSFRVKARANTGKQSVVASYTFTILPPWYRSRLAYVLYVLLFLGMALAAHTYQHNRYLRIQQNKLAAQQKRHQEEQKKLQYIQEIETGKKEKEIIQLKNEKLNAEIEYKNGELASKAMNLVQKSEMLSGIKEELLRLQTNAVIDKESKDFKKLIRTIDKELEIHEDWEQFAVHFDTVHTNFLKTIKERFPDLTANELKLCAYLRLSLSTKEMAQLMNISIRGVETSRYRLRKKLGLPNEANLFDFLLTFS